MATNVMRIVKCGTEGSWDIISNYETQGYESDICVVELRAHYIVDIQGDNPTVTRKFSLVQNDSESILWEGDSLKDRTLYGFSIQDFESPNTRGRINGIKVMDITHFLPISVYVVYEKEEHSTESDVSCE